MTDRDLLIAYQQSSGERSKDLFGQLVAHHINLVYSVAHRHVKESHAAQDVAQEVFLTFFRKAAAIDPQTPLAAWLYITTRLLSLQTLRAAERRQRLEREVAMSQDASASPDIAWPLIAEEVDAAVAQLAPPQRDVLILRYFAGKSHQEVASDLAISPDAATKRPAGVGIASSPAHSARVWRPRGGPRCCIGSHAAQAAPEALAASITQATFCSSASVATVLKGTLMASAKVKTAMAVIAALVLLLFPAILITIHLASRPSASPTMPGPAVPIAVIPAAAQESASSGRYIDAI